MLYDACTTPMPTECSYRKHCGAQDWALACYRYKDCSSVPITEAELQQNPIHTVSTQKLVTELNRVYSQVCVNCSLNP